jgi:D-alanine-D-alanine ligase
VDSPRVAVLFGGASSEHSISCISAAAVIDALRVGGFEVIPIVVSPAGRWCLYEGSTSRLRGEDEALPTIECDHADIGIALDWDTPGFVVRGHHMHVDAVFPVLHGPWGEDGTVQGLLEVAGIPYVGSGVLASAASMDKITMKRLLWEAGIPVGPWQAILGDADADDVTLELPVFVKPSRAGSSRGITRVTDRRHLPRALQDARVQDPRVIVEQAIAGAREIECGVRELVSGEVLASRCAEIIVDPAHEFYDFDAKYVDSGVELQVPAVLGDEVEERIRALARDAFLALGCAGLARVDFFIDREGAILVNELNTMPGFTSISMFPRMWEATGIDYPQLVGDLVRRAMVVGTGLR